MHQPNSYIGHDKRYQLLGCLGSGGTAEVWHAKDLHMSEKSVALKLFSADAAMDEAAIAKLQQEILLTMELSHPNTLTPNHFERNDGSPFIVMPLCRGGNLKSQISAQRKWTEAEMAELVKQMGSALAYLHDEGICHQDIKPENILIHREGFFKLTDFGISTQIEQKMSTQGRTTVKVGEAPLGGTFVFFAPEKTATSNPTQAMDIFALGVTLYEVAEGDLPYELPGLALHQGKSIPKIPVFSDGFNQVLASCMALDPEARPTAKQLEEWASSYLANGFWPVGPPKKKAEGKKMSKPLMAILATVVVVGLALAGLYFFTRGNDRPDTVEEAPVEVAPENLSERTESAAEMAGLTALVKIPSGNVDGRRVKAFLMEEHEVTNEQYCRFLNEKMRSQPEAISKYIGIGKLGCAVKTGRVQGKRQFVVEAGKGDFPVTHVSLQGAKAYAQWAGRELPTRVQWLAAAKNTGAAQGSSLQPVTRGSSSSNGLFGLVGNAREWITSGGECYVCASATVCSKGNCSKQEEGVGFRCVKN